MPSVAKPLHSLPLSLALAILSCSSGENEKSREPDPTPPPTTLAAPASVPRPTASRSPTTRPAPAARPVPETTAPPGVPKASPPPVPEPTAPPTTAPSVDFARVDKLVGEGEGALMENRLTDAIARFEEALALDPGNARARTGKARTATTSLGLKRRFVPDIPSADGVEGRVKEMDGFDIDNDLDVRRAARIPGSTEIEAAPLRMKPGETYKVQIYLRNQSRKKKRVIKITDLQIHRIVNGRASTLAASPAVREVPPKARLLVASIAGPWEDEVASWILDVQVLSEGGDVYQNRLVWK